MLAVVGGHSRNIGKTSVVAGLIRALPELEWTAMKITQFGHGQCSEAGEPCECETELEHPYAITEERDPASGTDSSRFLAAGARKSYWVRTRAGELGHAMPELRRIILQSANIIAESNSLLQFLTPDLYLPVVDFSVEDFKPTSLLYLDRADALVVVDTPFSAPLWRGVSNRLWRAKPRFTVQAPLYTSAELAAFVRAALPAGS